MTSRIALFICLFYFISSLLVSFAQPADSVTLNVSCREADLREVLRAIAVQHGISLTGLGNVSGKVTVHLDDVPLEDGLRALLEPLGFTYENRNGIYFLRREDAEAQRMTLSVAADKLTIDANHADVKHVIQMLNKQAGVSIVADAELAETITAHLKEIPIEDAIPALFAGNNCTLTQINGIYQVGSRQGTIPSGLTIFLNDGLVSINAREVLLNELLTEIGERAKINVATVGDRTIVNTPVTLRMQDKPLEEALADIALVTKNSYRKVRDIHFIGRGTNEPGENNPLLDRKVIWLKHLQARDIISMMPVEIPKQNLTISPSPDRNVVIVMGPPDIIEKAEQIIAELDIENAEIRTRQESAISVTVDAETERLTLDVKNAPIDEVVRELSIQTGIDILILGEVGQSMMASRIPTGIRRISPTTTQRRRNQQPQIRNQPPQTQEAQSQVLQQTGPRLPRTTLQNTVTLRMADASLEQVFTALFKGIDYTYKRENHNDKAFYIVGTGELLYSSNNPLVVSKLIPLNYLDVTKITELLPPTIPVENITVIPDQNALMIMGTSQMVEEIETYLAQLDVPIPQVMIQVYLLELTHGSRSELGLTLDGEKNRTTISLGPGLGLSFDTLNRVPQAFGTTLTALVDENRGRVLANPLVAVVSGEKANINVGVTTYFETTTEIIRGLDTEGVNVPIGGFSKRGFNTIDTGIELEITPWIGAGGEVTMELHPKVSSGDVGREQSIVAERSVDTVVRVKDQGMIVIGGLMQEREVVTENKVPVLHYIPLLGGLLFTNRNTSLEQTELIMIIQPKIIR